MSDANEHRIETSLDALNEGMQVLSPEWRYLYLNEAAARQGRMPREALVGRTMIECYPSIVKTPLFATLQRCMRERSADAIENEFTYEDGQRAWFELRIRPCPAGLILLSVDMTSRKAIEERREASYLEALRDVIDPVVRVHRGVLLLPIIGVLDSVRASRMTESILTRIVSESARVIILDVAGVPVMDTAVANHLLETTSMVRLLGATTILTGLTPAAAKSIVQLGIDLSAMETTSLLAEGIELALSKVGYAITRRS